MSFPNEVFVPGNSYGEGDLSAYRQAKDIPSYERNSADEKGNLVARYTLAEIGFVLEDPEFIALTPAKSE